MSEKIYFYMAKEGENAISIEDHFKGLRYVQCDGLLSKGKRTNVYTEKYSDSDTLRVWQGDEVVREATDITFKFIFVDTESTNRNDTYESFYNYVKNGKITYYDTKRNKEALMILVDAIKVKEDKWKGSTPYIEVDFKFQNLRGECIDRN